MHVKTRERGMRIVLASLLESDLSTRELKDLADGFSQYTFSKELSDLLHETIKYLKDSEEANKSEYHPQDFEELAYTIIQRRRLPKRTLVELIKRASPNSKVRQLQAHLSVRQILRDFFRTASMNDIDDFMAILQEGKRSDAYLKGIIQRN